MIILPANTLAVALVLGQHGDRFRQVVPDQLISRDFFQFWETGTGNLCWIYATSSDIPLPLSPSFPLLPCPLNTCAHDTIPPPHSLCFPSPLPLHHGTTRWFIWSLFMSVSLALGFLPIQRLSKAYTTLLAYSHPSDLGFCLGSLFYIGHAALYSPFYIPIAKCVQLLLNWKTETTLYEKTLMEQ